MATADGDTWATMHFRFLDGGVTRTAVVQLNAHRTGDAFDDLTFEVGQILAAAIQARTGYTLVSADLLTESVTRVFPPA